MLNLNYVAGLMDGEGSIGMMGTPKRGMSSIRVRIGMRNRMMMELMKQEFGGSVYSIETKCMSQWCIGGDKAMEFLKKIVDKLILKKSIAELAIRYQGNFSNRPLSEDVKSNRIKDHLKMKTLTTMQYDGKESELSQING